MITFDDEQQQQQPSAAVAATPATAVLVLSASKSCTLHCSTVLHQFFSKSY
jgi:hypothetical protein